jgi:hypothetical protein
VDQFTPSVEYTRLGMAALTASQYKPFHATEVIVAVVGKIPTAAGNQLIPSADHASELFVLLAGLLPPATHSCPFQTMLLNEEFREKAAWPLGDARNVTPS